MAETLYGPFRVVLDTADPFPLQRVIIAGSSNADGVYELNIDHPPLDLVVKGDEWSIEVQFLKSFPHAEWITSPFVHSTAFVFKEGLIVDLESGQLGSPSLGDGFHPSIRLICRSLDPATNPIPSNNPYDFTVPAR
ncbi:hypothetical protein [Streptomyces sp. NPDC058279]|uniref:hypothetical protein n=1 Tax=Streptomyces sp. NPDC058279 TaxID=3346418 RepID=UPI0036EF9F65